MHTWHALLAPLPVTAIPVERPLASPGILATPEGAAIADWRQLAIDLSAGCDGLRVVLVVLDGRGRLLSASDAVVYRREDADRVHFRHESLGGRFDDDGRFAGRHWMSEAVESLDGVAQESAPAAGREPTAEEVAALRTLAAEMIGRTG